MVKNWNPDSGGEAIPATYYDSLCRFDYQNTTQLAQAFAYRDAEVPFVVHNIPRLDNLVSMTVILCVYVMHII